MTILEDLKSGRLVVVPREARNAAAPENAGDAEALRVALELMNMRQNNGTKRDALLYEAAAFLKRRGYLVPASPDHTAGLIALVEGMAAERDMLVQTSAMLCDDCGWAMKFPDEGCVNCRALAAEAERDALKEALANAAEAIEHWGAYASSYLQEKHDWAGDIARARTLTQEQNNER
jgi:hypothetical protein